MKSITVKQLADQSVTIPGSKSMTHRMLICAALAGSDSVLYHPLDSEDTRLTREALSQMGVRIKNFADRVETEGCSGRLRPCGSEIYLGNSGTSIRLLMGIAALGEGTYTLTGNRRMQQRPVEPLLAALKRLGVACESVNGNGCPPVRVTGGARTGGRTVIDCSASSQYLSSLLLMAPCTRNGLDIRVEGGPVSRPYIDLTIDVMGRFGVTVRREGYQRFIIPGGQAYRGGTCTVEPDCSQASYFWAAAALSGAEISVTGISPDTSQGDVRFVEVLRDMGCGVRYGSGGIAVRGGRLAPVDVDMSHMPDLVPTLAVIAAFAPGRSHIRNVAHLRIKESDRLEAVSSGLRAMGIEVENTGEGLVIQGGTPRGAVIDTHDDHRIAMSFAVAGLMIPGMRIENEACVEKSFPDFWKVFEGLRAA